MMEFTAADREIAAAFIGAGISKLRQDYRPQSWAPRFGRRIALAPAVFRRPMKSAAAAILPGAPAGAPEAPLKEIGEYFHLTRMAADKFSTFLPPPLALRAPPPARLITAFC